MANPEEIPSVPLARAENHAEQPDGAADDEKTADVKKGLLEASLAWEPQGKPLELHESLKPYLEEDTQNIKKVQLLERILARHRQPTPAGDEHAPSPKDL